MSDWYYSYMTILDKWIEGIGDWSRVTYCSHIFAIGVLLGYNHSLVCKYTLIISLKHL